MQYSPLVSIVIPLYNRENIVRSSVESCLEQTYRNVEIIIVDDASTDRSVEVVRELMSKDSRIQLFKNGKNEKLGFTRNVGISKAKGELITFLDSDDLILPKKIETCVAAYQATQTDCINSSVISRFHNRTDEVSVIVPGGDPIAEYLTRKIVWKIIGPVWTRRYIDSLGWFTVGDEIFGSEDYEFHLRALIKGVRIHYLEEPLSIQVNVDPAIDAVKIRQTDKFESLARKKIFSRLLVLKTIISSSLPLRSKLRYSKLILYYLTSLMKRSLQRLSLGGFFKITWYLFRTVIRGARTPRSFVNAGQ